MVLKNKSSFLLCSVIVDPTNLSEGLHYYEVYGIDCKAPWRGPLFRIPVTITKPKVVKNRPPLISFQGMSFCPGDLQFCETTPIFINAKALL